jgi:hypothetical protein
VIVTIESNGPFFRQPPGKRAGVAVELIPGDREGFVVESFTHGAQILVS